MNLFMEGEVIIFITLFSEYVCKQLPLWSVFCYVMTTTERILLCDDHYGVYFVM